MIVAKKKKKISQDKVKMPTLIDKAEKTEEYIPYWTGLPVNQYFCFALSIIFLRID